MSMSEFSNLLIIKYFYIGAYVGGGGAAAATEVTDEVFPGDETEGHWKEGPDMIISLMRVSIGVLPTNRTKKSCSITCDDTVLNEGSRKRSLPNRVG